MYSNIVNSCNYLLNNYPEAESCLNYLNSRLNKNSQDNFKFGYFPSINNINVLTNLIGEEELLKYNLFYSKVIEDSLYPRTIKSSYFENYPLIMPFKNTYGKIVALVGRTLLDENERKIRKISKYKNTVFSKTNYLFGLYENKQYILEQDSVYVVEGQFDVIKSFENGFKNVVATGSSYMTANQFALITRYTNNIFLLFDNDEAGEKGRKITTSKFENLANIRNLYLPKEYKDIDEYYSAGNCGLPPFTIKT